MNVNRSVRELNSHSSESRREDVLHQEVFKDNQCLAREILDRFALALFQILLKPLSSTIDPESTVACRPAAVFLVNVCW